MFSLLFSPRVFLPGRPDDPLYEGRLARYHRRPHVLAPWESWGPDRVR